MTNCENVRINEINAVRELGRKIGYGNMMELASVLWAIDSGNIKEPLVAIPQIEVDQENLSRYISLYKDICSLI